jgi:hypothetical protein
MYDGNSLPIDITPKITDKVNGKGVMDLISKANYAEFCAGVKDAEGKYLISLGNLSTKSGSYVTDDTNVVMEFDVNNGNWKERQYQGIPLAFTSFINSSGSKDLYAIHKTNAYISKFDTGTTDDGAATDANAIAVEVITPYHLLSNNPTVTTTIKEYYVKYKAENTVAVSDSIDNGDFSSLVTLPVSSTVKTIAIVPTPNREGFTHALKFVTTGSCTIYGYGFTVEENTTTYIPKV